MTHNDTDPTTSVNQPDNSELWASLERPLPQWFAQEFHRQLSPLTAGSVCTRWARCRRVPV